VLRRPAPYSTIGIRIGILKSSKRHLSAGERAVENSRRFSRRRLARYVGISLGVVVITLAICIIIFGGAILNSYGKTRIERAYSKANPGSELQIGDLEYAVGANRLVARSVTLTTKNMTLDLGQMTLTGIPWGRILLGTRGWGNILAQANLDLINLKAEFHDAQYGLRCARLHASVPASELTAQEVRVEPFVEDEAFFAAQEFRATRFQVVLPECRVSGLEYGELIEGTAYRALSVHFTDPYFEAMINSDKEPPPRSQSPPMAHEALAAIEKPLRVEYLSVTNGLVAYAERPMPGVEPGVLTFGKVSLAIENLSNRGSGAESIEIQGHGDLMNAATLEARLSIPISPPAFALHYSGSLAEMELARLNRFLEPVEQIRINSGTAQSAEFEIEVREGQARGRVRALYDDLDISLLDEETGSPRGIRKRFVSFLANLLKVQKSNQPDQMGELRVGDVSYTRSADDQFLEFLWVALRSGLLDLISH
jgi:hypothetical protein